MIYQCVINSNTRRIGNWTLTATDIKSCS